MKTSRVVIADAVEWSIRDASHRLKLVRYLEGLVIKRALRALFTKREKPTYFEIQLTDKASFLLRPLTREARVWSERFLADPVANGDHLVSSAIVTAIAAEAIKRGYLVRFV